MDELAQDNKVPWSMDTVNGAAVLRKPIYLSGEICPARAADVVMKSSIGQ